VNGELPYDLRARAVIEHEAERGSARGALGAAVSLGKMVLRALSLGGRLRPIVAERTAAVRHAVHAGDDRSPERSLRERGQAEAEQAAGDGNPSESALHHLPTIDALNVASVRMGAKQLETSPSGTPLLVNAGTIWLVRK